MTRADPRLDAPSRNVTDPVSVPGNADDMVAVNVTDCPETEGLFVEARTVVEVPLTNWLTVREELVSNVASAL
jgi:hypothetical protein